MSKGRASKEAREPDAFLRISGEIIKAVRPYSKQLFIGSILIAAAAAIAVVLNFLQEKKEVQAQAEYVQAEKTYVKKTTDFIESQAKIKTLETELEGLKKAKAPRSRADIEKDLAEAKAKLPSGDFDKDYGSLAAGFKNVVNVYPQTQAAIMASLYLAQIYTENKKYDQGVATLSNTQLKFRDGKLLYGLAQMKLGQLYEQTGQCQKSIETWSKILAYKELNYFHPEATLASAVCYETLKNPDKAQELYKKTHADFKNTPAGANAQKYLRLMSLKAKDS